jgi:hypothetical protein
VFANQKERTLVRSFVFERLKIDFESLPCLEFNKAIAHKHGGAPQSARPTEEIMMDQIFDWCVNVLVYWAGIFGITYKEINVWVFVIIWPVLTVILIGIVVQQQKTIRKLSGK